MGSALLICLEGEFDCANADELSQVLSAPAARDAETLIVSFANTTFIDSTVIRTLIEIRTDRLLRDAKLILIELSPSVRRVFDILNCDAIFDVRRNTDRRLLDIDIENVQMLRLSLEPLEA